MEKRVIFKSRKRKFAYLFRKIFSKVGCDLKDKHLFRYRPMCVAGANFIFETEYCGHAHERDIILLLIISISLFGALAVTLAPLQFDTLIIID